MIRTESESEFHLRKNSTTERKQLICLHDRHHISKYEIGCSNSGENGHNSFVQIGNPIRAKGKPLISISSNDNGTAIQSIIPRMENILMSEAKIKFPLRALHSSDGIFFFLRTCILLHN